MKRISFCFLFFFLCFSLPAFSQHKNEASPQNLLEETVHSLTKNIKNPFKKAEVLAIFVAEHFERNGFIKKEKENAARKRKSYQFSYQNNLFETKIGDSYDFADLYQKLCTQAGLKAIVIEGYAGKRIESFGVKRKEQKAIRQASQLLTGKKDTSLEKYKSAWNAVQINDKWILVDTYWMVQGEKYAYKNITSEKKMERILEQNKKKKLTKKNSSIDMDFFDAKPKEMIKTHYPFDPTYQFLKNPYSLTKFLNH